MEQMLPTEKHKKLLDRVDEFFTQKVRAYGATPAGADFNSESAQQIRFDQLAKLIDDRSKPFSIIDYGCGYGALYEYLRLRDYSITNYVGFDISTQMISEAQKTFASDPRATFTSQECDLVYADYVIVSGIFNVKLTAAQ